jgi:hypothetical protein
MTSAQIVNGAPMTIALGTQDLSTETVTPTPEQIPQHLPLIYLYAQQGPLTTELVTGADLTNMYGTDSFDLRKQWANHATVLANTVNAAGNAIQVQRLQPADAAPPATLRLYLDVLAATIPQYQRNSDGSFVTDTSGNPVPVTGSTTTAAGYVAKWVVKQINYTTTDGVTTNDFGSATIVAGDLTYAGATGTSQRYPIMDLMVPSFGSYGNSNGIRLWAPTTQSSTPVNPNYLEDDMVYPFRIACVQQSSATGTAAVVATLDGEQYLDFTFKPNVIDLDTDSQISLGDIFIPAWQDLNDPSGIADQFGPFGQLAIYNSNIATLVGMFYTAEYAVNSQLGTFTDFTGAAGEQWLFNFVGATSSQGAPYSTFQLNTSDTDAAYLSQASNLYAAGGTDGTMTDTLFAGLVTDAIAAYADVTNPVMDMVGHPESIFWDSGFPLATKQALAQFISQRKDLFVALSTFSTLSPILTASEESSMAVALKSYLQQFPESDYYGTPTMRGMIVPGSGTLTGSLYSGMSDTVNTDLPLTIELAQKSATYMGAGNGKWKAGYAFDTVPGSEIDLFSNINVTFWPATVRNTDWTNGMVGVELYGRRQAYFPALKTIYDNDTSVLNSFFNAVAICYLEKIGDMARRTFSGVTSMTNAQLITAVNKYVTNAVNGIFDNRFVITPVTTISGGDAQRGYSWTLVIQAYMPNMKTVATVSIQSYRLDSLTSSTSSGS